MNSMTLRTALTSCLLAGSLAISAGAWAQPQGYGPGYGMGPGMMGGYGAGQGGPYGPGYGMGPGMMGGYGPGYGMGPGMMGGYGPGYGMGPGMMGGMMGPGMMGGWGGGGPGMMGGGMGYGMLFQLNLSNDQWNKVNAIHEDLGKKQWDLMGKMREEGYKLRNLLVAEKRDRAALTNQYKKVQDLRLQAFQTRLEAREKIEGVLTADQKTQLRRFAPWWGQEAE
jgi:Spy/CpxP family protein refolding chaperone